MLLNNSSSKDAPSTQILSFSKEDLGDTTKKIEMEIKLENDNCNEQIVSNSNNSHKSQWLENFISASNDITKQVAELLAENEELGLELTEKNNALDELQSEFENLESSFNLLQDEKNDLCNSNEELKKEINKLKKIITEKDDIIKSQASTIEILNKKTQEQETENKELKFIVADNQLAFLRLSKKTSGNNSGTTSNESPLNKSPDEQRKSPIFSGTTSPEKRKMPNTTVVEDQENLVNNNPSKKPKNMLNSFVFRNCYTVDHRNATNKNEIEYVTSSPENSPRKEYKKN